MSFSDLIKPGTLKPEIKTEWLKRLRSGKYPQGRTDLNGRNGLCCLGVLCEIAADQGIVRREFTPGRPTAYVTITDEDAAPGEVWTPESVARWALEESSFVGLDGDQIVDYPWRSSLLYEGGTVTMSLAQMNDAMEGDKHIYDFHAIANQIEKDY